MIFLFLRSTVATLIPSLTLPMSIIGTFSVMYVLDFSIDNLSLMALTLAVGFVVDDAIVMLENIVRHMEMGKPPMQAAFEGSQEVGFTILSMTLSLATVFIPLMFMGGIIGRLFKEFAITIMVAILVSGFVSLTLTPMLCSRLLKPRGSRTSTDDCTMSPSGVFEATLHAYERSLAWVMQRRPLMLAFSLLILALTAGLWQVIPKGLFPPDDTGSLNGTTEAAQGTSFAEMVRLQKIAMARLENGHEHRVVHLVRRRRRWLDEPGPAQRHAQARSASGRRPTRWCSELTRRMSGIPGLSVFFANPPAIRIGGRSTKTLYQFTLRGQRHQVALRRGVEAACATAGRADAQRRHV